jgi:hypothetical protein
MLNNTFVHLFHQLLYKLRLSAKLLNPVIVVAHLLIVVILYDEQIFFRIFYSLTNHAVH